MLVLVELRERMSSKSCLGRDIELLTLGPQKVLLHPHLASVGRLSTSIVALAYRPEIMDRILSQSVG